MESRGPEETDLSFNIIILFSQFSNIYLIIRYINFVVINLDFWNISNFYIFIPFIFIILFFFMIIYIF